MLLPLLKLAHVLLAMTAFGLDLAYGYVLVRATRERSAVPEPLDTLDRRVATPAFWLLLGTGAALAWVGGVRWTEPWLVASLVLYALAAIGGWVGFARSGDARWYAIWCTTLLILLASIAALMVLKPGR